jgi:hypothetical protein
MLSEQDLLSADISFDPPLYNKRSKKHQVYLIAYKGSIVQGRIQGITLHRKVDRRLGGLTVAIDVPSVLIYGNRPEYDFHEFPITDLTRDILRVRIRESFDLETRRIRQT